MFTAAVPGNQFRHLALLYHGHGEYLSVLRAFIQACAARGDVVFVAVPRRKALLVRQELGDDPAPATLADMAELGRNPARIIPAVLLRQPAPWPARLLYRGADLARPHSRGDRRSNQARGAHQPGLP